VGFWGLDVGSGRIEEARVLGHVAVACIFVSICVREKTKEKSTSSVLKYSLRSIILFANVDVSRHCRYIHISEE
jgi:hypothetical protein